MSELLCSVLLPSRARLQKCERCIQSFIAAEPERHDFDILIRVDDDEPEMDGYKRLAENYPVKVFTGVRWGFKLMSHYHTELSKASTAIWGMQFNDDATISGPWLSKLEKVPTEGYFAYCEWHKLGGSTYRKDWGGPFPILPNRFWEPFGRDGVPHVADKGSIKLVMGHGWKPWTLEGVTFHHQRDDDKTLEAHRKL